MNIKASKWVAGGVVGWRVHGVGAYNHPPMNSFNVKTFHFINTHPPIKHIQSVTLSLYIYFGRFMGWVVDGGGVVRGFMGWVGVLWNGWLESSWGGWWWNGWLEGSWGGLVCGGVCKGMEVGDVGFSLCGGLVKTTKSLSAFLSWFISSLLVDG